VKKTAKLEAGSYVIAPIGKGNVPVLPDCRNLECQIPGCLKFHLDARNTERVVPNAERVCGKLCWMPTTHQNEYRIKQFPGVINVCCGTDRPSFHLLWIIFRTAQPIAMIFGKMVGLVQLDAPLQLRAAKYSPGVATPICGAARPAWFHDHGIFHFHVGLQVGTAGYERKFHNHGNSTSATGK
jgi:hypothetical protein